MKLKALNAEEKTVAIADVIPWDKNPRSIMDKDYARLKNHILKLGVYKRLLVFRENGKYIVLGGNMRLRALQEFKQAEVAVSIVKPKSEKEKIEYSLSDNDRAGFYDEGALVELVYPYKNDIIMEDFKIDLAKPADLRRLVEAAGPEIPNPGQQAAPKLDSDHFIEIYCSKEGLKQIKKTLDEWSELEGFTINIS